MKVVPFPSSLSNVTVPSNASVIRLTTAKPNPWPFDFVVNHRREKLRLDVFQVCQRLCPLQLSHVIVFLSV